MKLLDRLRLNRLRFIAAPHPATVPTGSMERAERRAVQQLSQKRAAFVQSLQGTQAFEGFVNAQLPYKQPEELVRRKGLQVFHEMDTRDDMVSTSLAYLYLAVLSEGWHIEPADETPQGLYWRDWHEYNLQGMRGTVSQFLLSIAEGCGEGFSLGEFVWGDQIVGGIHSGRQPYAYVANKNTRYIEFKVDAFGQVEKEGVWQRNYIGATEYVKADLQDVIYFCFRPKRDNPYGSPLMRPMYPWYYFKHFCLKEWARFLEQFGLPLLQGKVSSDVEDSERTSFNNLLKEVRNALTFVTDETMEVLIHQVNQQATQSFHEAIQVANRAIARSALLPELVLEHNLVGSMAASKDKSGTQFAWPLKFIQQQVAESVTSQHFLRSQIHNGGPAELCPTFLFNDFDEEDLQTVATTWKILSELGLPFSERAVRERFGIEAPTEEDILIGGKPMAPESGYLVPGMTEQGAGDLVEMAHDAARRKLGPRKSYFPPAKLAFAQGGGNGEGALKELERHVDFDATNKENDRALAYWSSIGAVVFGDIADELEEREGKARGARRL